jgi:hypothetical protein
MLIEGLGWCLPFECLARPVVEGGGDCVELVLVVAGQVGKYWRSSPFVFSSVPRCQGLCGSQK